jgi:hypothetical protein
MASPLFSAGSYPAYLANSITSSIPSSPSCESLNSSSGYTTPFSAASLYSVMNHPKILFDKINNLADVVSRVYNDGSSNNPSLKFLDRREGTQNTSLLDAEITSNFSDGISDEDEDSTSSGYNLTQSSLTSTPQRPRSTRHPSYTLKTPKANSSASVQSNSFSDSLRFRHSRFFSASSTSSAKSSQFGSSKSNLTGNSGSSGKNSAVAGLIDNNGSGMNLKYLAQSIQLATEALEASDDTNFASESSSSRLGLVRRFELTLTDGSRQLIVIFLRWNTSSLLSQRILEVKRFS